MDVLDQGGTESVDVGPIQPKRVPEFAGELAGFSRALLSHGGRRATRRGTSRLVRHPQRAAEVEYGPDEQWGVSAIGQACGPTRLSSAVAHLSPECAGHQSVHCGWQAAMPGDGHVCNPLRSALKNGIGAAGMATGAV